MQLLLLQVSAGIVEMCGLSITDISTNVNVNWQAVCCGAICMTYLLHSLCA